MSKRGWQHPLKPYQTSYRLVSKLIGFSLDANYRLLSPGYAASHIYGR